MLEGPRPAGGCSLSESEYPIISWDRLLPWRQHGISKKCVNETRVFTVLSLLRRTSRIPPRAWAGSADGFGWSVRSMPRGPSWTLPAVEAALFFFLLLYVMWKSWHWIHSSDEDLRIWLMVMQEDASESNQQCFIIYGSGGICKSTRPIPFRSN